MEKSRRNDYFFKNWNLLNYKKTKLVSIKLINSFHNSLKLTHAIEKLKKKSQLRKFSMFRWCQKKKNEPLCFDKVFSLGNKQFLIIIWKTSLN